MDEMRRDVSENAERKALIDISVEGWRFTRETLINGPTAQIAVETASNFPDDKAIRRSIR
ncbi:hypothetical protein OKW43_002771 [Paraburkholderia sp. WC7.3g]|uniref:hypothetical protein n=1 Tax=Paraburkholderia sp. WC7.3g TaxID=2991070 RepID=UPI003D245312